MKTVLALTTGTVLGLMVGMFAGATFVVHIEDEIGGSLYHSCLKMVKTKED